MNRLSPVKLSLPLDDDEDTTDDKTPAVAKTGLGKQN
jgi:hypothetical protein